MQKQSSDVRFRLWETLLTRLDLAKDTASGNRFFFTFDEGELGGIKLPNFQFLAIKKLANMGAFSSIQEIDHPLQKDVGSKYSLQPIGFTLSFEKKVLRGVLRRMRIANALGDVDVEPVFELTLDEGSIAITDLEEDRVYPLHKLRYRSQADELFSYIFNQGKLKVTRRDLETASISIDQKLGKLVRDVKINGVLLSAFVPIADNDHIEIRSIVTAEHLKSAGASKESVIEYLKAVGRKRKST